MRVRQAKVIQRNHLVSTVGLNEAAIARYIREQEQQDTAKDKLSVKEYEDPFRGRKRGKNTRGLNGVKAKAP